MERRGRGRGWDDELYDRGAATMLAAWEAYARGANGDAVLHRLTGVAIGVFPDEPERAIYNNALIERGLAADERVTALDAMEEAYGAAGVSAYAVWVHETETAVIEELEDRGFRFDQATRAMGVRIEDATLASGDVELGSREWKDHLRCIEVTPDLLDGLDESAFHVAIAKLDGGDVSTALAFDHDGDCGIYNVATLKPARRRGIAGALNAVVLRDAAVRGCLTASVQASEMAEGMYAAAGFRDLGRFLEYVPG